MSLEEQYKDIISKQRSYFESAATLPLSFRIKALQSISANIKKHETRLLEAIQKDLGKSHFESYVCEVGLCLENIKHIIRMLPEWMEKEHVGSPLFLFKSSSWKLASPKGVTLIIGAWNYPFQLVFEPLVASLSAGNTAVVKFSEFSPNTNKIIKELISETFPAEYVTCIEGGVPETTELLKNEFDHIFFTGSTVVGKIIMRAAAEHLTPVTLELGGKSPCIIDETADLDVSAKRVLWGKATNSGQTCVAPDYLLVHSSIAEKFYKKLEYYNKKFFGENFVENQEYPHIINERQYNRLKAMLQNKEFIFGGKCDDKSRKIEITLVKNVDDNDPLLTEEIFGPIMPVIEYRSIEELKAEVKKRPNPLAFYVFSKNTKLQNKLLEEVSFGGAGINTVLTHVSVPDLPFGGTRQSGIGSYHGKAGFDTFTHYKGVSKMATWHDPSIKYPPYAKKFKLLKFIMG